MARRIRESFTLVAALFMLAGGLLIATGCESGDDAEDEIEDVGEEIEDAID